jgi:hypothetical protein
MNSTHNHVRGDVQRLYARVLEVGTHVGFSILVITFILYVSGVLHPAVPPARLQDYWHLPAREYLAAVNRDYLGLASAPVGWQWLQCVGYSDYMNLIGIAALVSTTTVCFLAIIPKLYCQRRKTYLAIAVLEVLVLLLAASGLLTAGL